MGKPMANGIACSATAVKHDILDAFNDKIPYFNTCLLYTSPSPRD